MSPAPRTTISQYDLALEVDFDAGRWQGRVTFPPPEGPAGLELDCEALEIRAVHGPGGPVPFQHDPRAGRLHLPPSNGSSGPLSVDFAGQVVPGLLVGLYRCAHAEGTVLTSQCEPVGARRIFPCVDEPDRKARIRLTVRTRPDLEVISNTPAERIREPDGAKEWVFAPTPPMSTYLFYLAIGRFDRAETRAGPVTVRVLGPPGRGRAGEFAVQAGGRILEGYEEYFRIPYPLPKLDMVAVADHAFGAMENWGAISYRDMRLLVDPTADTFTRRDVFETVAHEIAHQWFGNLVTMASWDDIWLNESFAALMETRITQRLAPELDPLTDFYLRVAGAAAAFEGDSLRSTHPVRAHVSRPEEIGQIFDEISYGKGSSFLAMLEGYLGPEKFRAGVVDYLGRFRYGNARTEDLWDALASQSGQPVAEIAGPWIDRPGHPVISARREGSRLHLTQSRYCLTPLPATEPPWPIPLVVDVDGERRSLVFRERTLELPVPPGSAVHLNPGAVGFYRVRYEGELFDRLLEVLPTRPPTDRWSVVKDLASFLYSGDSDWATFRRALDALGATDSLLLTDTFSTVLMALHRTFPTSASVSDATRAYLAERVTSVGIRRRPGEPTDHGILRERLCSHRVRADEAFARDLAELFEEWPRLDPDLRPAVAVARARTGGAAAWGDLRRALARTVTEGERVELSRALAWTGEPAQLESTLDLLLTGEIIRGHSYQVLPQATANPAGRDVVWPWLTRHLEELATGYHGTGYLSLVLERTIPWVGLGRADEVRAFFGAHPFPEGSRGVMKGLERLEIAERLQSRVDLFSS